MIKQFEAIFDKNNRGVYSISLVESPAMEGDFIALSKNKKLEFKTVDEEQRVLLGLVLEPNKPIYRNDKGEEYNIVFSEKTIKDLSHNFFKQGYQTNSSLEHNKDVQGVSFVESWIVEDSKIDKSANFGFSYPKGSWIATMKVDDDAIWNDYVKTGKIKGFSIDAFLTLKEIKLNKHNNMNEEIKTGFAKLKEDLMVALKLKEKEQEVKLGMVKSKDGAVQIDYEGESLEVGLAIWVTAEDGSRVPLEEGEIALDDGRILVVGKDSLIAEVKDAEKPAEEENLTEESGAGVPNQSTVDAIKSVLIKYSEQTDVRFSKIEDELKITNEENVKLKEELLELSKQPASTPIKTVVAQKSYANMSNIEKMKFNKGL